MSPPPKRISRGFSWSMEAKTSSERGSTMSQPPLHWITQESASWSTATRKDRSRWAGAAGGGAGTGMSRGGAGGGGCVQAAGAKSNRIRILIDLGISHPSAANQVRRRRSARVIPGEAWRTRRPEPVHGRRTPGGQSLLRSVRFNSASFNLTSFNEVWPKFLAASSSASVLARRSPTDTRLSRWKHLRARPEKSMSDK